MPISNSTYEQLENIKTVDDLKAVIERARVEVGKDWFSMFKSTENIIGEFLTDYANRALRFSASNGYKEIVELLLKYPAVVANIAAEDNYAFRWASSNGQKEIVELLLTYHTVEVNIAVQANHALRLAALNGHKEIVELLLKYPAVMTNIATEDNYALRFAASNGDKEIVELLLKYPAVVANIAALDNDAFRRATENGHKEIVVLLLKYRAVVANIAAVQNEAFRLAASKGHKEIVELLLKYRAVVVNIVAQDNYALRYAARKGHKSIVELLLKYPDVVANIATYNNYAFRYAAENGHKEIVELLLKYPAVFSYAEQHEREYGQYVSPFIENHFTKLMAQKDAYIASHTNGVFDIAAENQQDIELCYLIIRNLVRTSNSINLNMINELLLIPAIEAKAADNDNELLRLAMRLNNQDAIQRLMQIPSVRRLAAQHNFYQDEANGNVDLAAIARNTESSMIALSDIEKTNLRQLADKYQPIIAANGGVEQAFQGLLTYLRETYNKAPAKYGNVTLPLEWQALQTLKQQQRWTEQQYTEALQQYYQHPIHSALRYLSRPNYWMHPNAAYVRIEENNQNLRFSTFEEYKGMITLLWTAASDQQAINTRGGSIQDRINFFINSLALINRAHNWNHTRNRTIVDAKTGAHKLIKEEYDDLTADRPSCYSGVNRRLFESLFGHELFNPVTEETLKLDLRIFVYEYYVKLFESLTEEQKQSIRQALYAEPNGYFYSLAIAQSEPLLPFNMPDDIKQQFKAELIAKYKDKPHLNCAMFCERMFNTSACGNSDILRFYESCGLSALLESLGSKMTVSLPRLRS